VALTIRPVEYFHADVQDDIATASRTLSQLVQLGVKLLAFSAIPSTSSSIRFAIVPDDPLKLAAEAARAQLALEGPHFAFLVEGDDQLRELADIQLGLLSAHVDSYASGGLADERGAFVYLVFVREDQFPAAAEALDVEQELLSDSGPQPAGAPLHRDTPSPLAAADEKLTELEARADARAEPVESELAEASKPFVAAFEAGLRLTAPADPPKPKRGVRRKTDP
jgi:hypothetical protein